VDNWLSTFHITRFMAWCFEGAMFLYLTSGGYFIDRSDDYCIDMDTHMGRKGGKIYAEETQKFYMA
jgi:hypothetical protein